MGIAWNLISTIFNQGSTLVVNLWIASTLGQHRFGEYAIVLGTVQVASLVANLGLGYTAARYMAELRVADRVRAGRVLALCALLAATAAISMWASLGLLAPLLADRLYQAPHLTPLIRWGSGVAAAMIVNGLLNGVLAGLESYRSLAWIGFVSGVIYFTACAAFGRIWGLEGVLIGMCVAAVLQSCLLLVAARSALRRNGIRPVWRGLRDERRVVLHFAIPTALAGAITPVSFWLGQAILVRQPGGYDQMALYAAAFNLMSAVLLLPSVANNVGMSLLNSVRGGGDPRQFRWVFRRNLLLTAAFVGAGALGTLLLSPWLLGLYGPSFRAALPALAILLAGVLFESFSMATNQMLQSRERMWQAMRVLVLPRDALLPIGALLLAPLYGARGLALAYLASRITGFGCTAAAVRRIWRDGGRLTREPSDPPPRAAGREPMAGAPQETGEA